MSHEVTLHRQSCGLFGPYFSVSVRVSSLARLEEEESEKNALDLPRPICWLFSVRARGIALFAYLPASLKGLQMATSARTEMPEKEKRKRARIRRVEIPGTHRLWALSI